MTHSMKHRLTAFGAALLFLLLSGCQRSGVLVLPDGADPAQGTVKSWQQLLLDEMDKTRTDGRTFQHSETDDAMADKVLAHVKECSGDHAEQAGIILNEDAETGYAVDARDIQWILGIPEDDKTRLVGYAIVPKNYAGDMKEEMAGQLVKEIMEHRCFLSKAQETEQTETSRVGFAMGEVGTKTFIIALFQ